MASRGYIGATPADTPFDTSPFIEMLRGAISGLVQSQAADTDHDITLSVGGALDDTHSDWLALSSAITKQIDAAWAAGTNQGGLDTGAVANSTWYYIWLIKNPSSGTVDALFSTSASSPTMPSGYSLKRLVGAVITDSSANIVAFTAVETSGGGLNVLWTTPTLDVNLAATLTTSRRTDTIKVPSSISVFATVRVVTLDTASAYIVNVSSPAETDVAPSTTAAPLSNAGGGSANTPVWVCDLRIRTSDATIAARANIATVDAYRVVTLGWDWSRR
jgi:hypothetical protein